MLSAHMDEVGFIITHISDDGYLKFSPVGGIDPRVVIDRVVNVNGKKGVIGAKAVHQLSDEEKKTAPDFSKLYIDIGAKNKADAEKYISLGDFAYFVAACPHLLTLVTGADGCAGILTERKNALGCHFSVAQHGQCHIFVVFRRLGIMKDLRHHLVVFTAKHERAVV